MPTPQPRYSSSSSSSAEGILTSVQGRDGEQQGEPHALDGPGAGGDDGGADGHSHGHGQQGGEGCCAGHLPGKGTVQQRARHHRRQHHLCSMRGWGRQVVYHAACITSMDLSGQGHVHGLVRFWHARDCEKVPSTRAGTGWPRQACAPSRACLVGGAEVMQACPDEGGWLSESLWGALYRAVTRLGHRIFAACQPRF